jgi:shikimate kinase/3-dehydroquinate synthase
LHSEGERRGMAAGKASGAVKRRKIRVDLGDRSYPIQIGSGTLDEAGPAIAKATGASQVVIVTVPEVGKRYAARLTRSLKSAGLKVHRVVVPDGDSTKNLRELARLYDAFLEFGLDRSSAVVALGGGVVGDLAGFAAASYLRGIGFVQVPTTILSMVDASIGGKTAVNLKQGKNLVGAFYQPSLVWIDIATLHSLPARQRAAGMAEVIKAGAIWDARLFSKLEKEMTAALSLDPVALVPILQRACAIKAQVVSQDEREAGVRMLLNFGHTLAHAVEKKLGYRKVLHGEAVAMGMVFAAKRSEELGFAPDGTRERLENLINLAGLPIALPSFPRRAYLSGLQVDKKKTDKHIRFVVLHKIGKADTVPLTPEEIYPA